MNKILDTPPVEDKPKRKTATRRTVVKKKVVVLETAPPPTPMSAPEIATTKPLPALTDPTPEIYIYFEDTGEEIFSDIPGAFTVGKRLAMAYAKVTKTANSFAGISNPLEAFAITKAEQNGRHLKVFVRIKETADVMRFPAADEKFIAGLRDQQTLGQNRGARHEVPAIKYGMLSRMRRSGDCPHCGVFVGSDQLAHTTTDQGNQQVATCHSCHTVMRSPYS